MDIISMTMHSSKTNMILTITIIHSKQDKQLKFYQTRLVCRESIQLIWWPIV